MTFHQNYPPQVLKIHGELLIALSLLFANGGEKLTQTLDPLVKSIADFTDHYKLDELLLSNKALAQHSNSDDQSHLLLCYEFNRLFVGPTAPVAPPYESVYLSPDHLIMGEQTLEVRKMYMQENLQSQGQGHEPDDFIATELEFIAYLLTRIMDAQAAKNDIQIQHYTALYLKFWTQHPSLWLGLFAQRIREATHHPVFLALSEVLDTLTTLTPIKHEGGPL